MGLGHAKDLAKNLVVHFENKVGLFKPTNKRIELKYFKNGDSLIPPYTGSILSFHSGQYGHTAIVRKIVKHSDDKLQLYLFEQHGELSFNIGEVKPIRSFYMTKNKDMKWHHRKVIGWITPLIVD